MFLNCTNLLLWIVPISLHPLLFRFGQWGHLHCWEGGMRMRWGGCYPLPAILPSPSCVHWLWAGPVPLSQAKSHCLWDGLSPVPVPMPAYSLYFWEFFLPWPFRPRSVNSMAPLLAQGTTPSFVAILHELPFIRGFFSDWNEGTPSAVCLDPKCCW